MKQAIPRRRLSASRELEIFFAEHRKKFPSVWTKKDRRGRRIPRSLNEIAQNAQRHLSTSIKKKQKEHERWQKHAEEARKLLGDKPML